MESGEYSNSSKLSRVAYMSGHSLFIKGVGEE